MRSPYRSLLFALCSGALVFQSIVLSTYAGEAERLTFTGRVFMEPVDTRRILIAVTTHPDGSAEHLFLYTASKPLRVTPRLRNVQAHVEYEQGRGLRLIPDRENPQAFVFIVSRDFQPEGPDGAIRFEQTTGLSHYVADPPLRIEDLKALLKTGECGQSPQSCVAAGGQFLPFPG